VTSGTSSPGTCTLASLTGTYSTAIEWTQNGTPEASVIVQSYDGAGHVAYERTDTNGSTSTSTSGVGTYGISSGCIISANYDGSSGTPFIYFVSPNGAAYWWIDNQNSGAVAAGKATQVSHALTVKAANQWVGSWTGSVTSTCAYSGAFNAVITSLGGSLLDVSYTTSVSGLSGSYDMVIAGKKAQDNQGLGITYTLNGNTIKITDTSACQTGTLTRQ
jgi:hypothetical protein